MDFPILPILLILYVIVVSGGKKKKTKQPKKPARAMSRAQAREERSQQRTVRAASQAEAREARTPSEHTARGLDTAFDRMQREPVPEGEDFCHPAPDWEKSRADEPECDQPSEMGQEALAQDVLRGVIMSEILTRPSERRARNRQGYHG